MSSLYSKPTSNNFTEFCKYCSQDLRKIVQRVSDNHSDNSEKTTGFLRDSFLRVQKPVKSLYKTAASKELITSSQKGRYYFPAKNPIFQSPKFFQ